MPAIPKRALLAVGVKNEDGFPVSLTIENVESGPATLPSDLTVTPDEDGELGSADKVAELALKRPGKADLERIGRYLWNLLMREPLLALWEKESPGSTIELRFDVKADEVARLPLEALNDGNVFLASSAETRLTRVHKAHPPHAEEVLPLRVLIVVGAPAGGSIDYATELAALSKLFRSVVHQVDWEILERPSLTKLNEFCERFRPHVFHFIGHGKLHGKKQEPALELWDDRKNPPEAVLLKRDDLKSFLGRPDWQMRMALFNACRTESPGTKDEEKKNAASRKAALGLGRLFIEEFGGCCAVSMQGDIKGTAAAAFSRKFYEELIGGSAVDLAVARARLHLKQEMRDEPDWIYPVLQVGCAPEAAAPSKFGVAPVDVENLKRAFNDLTLFVDRTNERRDLWASIAYGLQKSKDTFAVVTGQQQIGKTAIVRWLMRNHALRGYAVRLVDFADGKTHDYKSFLETIRNDCQRPLWGYHEALPEDDCKEFDGALTAFREQKPLVNKSVADLFSKFVKALTSVAAKKPLLIVLDHFSRSGIDADRRGLIDDSDAEAIINGLFVPVAGGIVPNVKMIVVTLQDELKNPPLDGLDKLGLKVEVDLFEEGFERLALELVGDLADDFLGVAQITAEAINKRLPKRWAPKWLRQFRDKVTSLEKDLRV